MRNPPPRIACNMQCMIASALPPVPSPAPSKVGAHYLAPTPPQASTEVEAPPAPAPAAATSWAAQVEEEQQPAALAQAAAVLSAALSPNRQPTEVAVPAPPDAAHAPPPAEEERQLEQPGTPRVTPAPASDVADPPAPAPSSTAGALALAPAPARAAASSAAAAGGSASGEMEDSPDLSACPEQKLKPLRLRGGGSNDHEASSSNNNENVANNNTPHPPDNQNTEYLANGIPIGERAKSNTLARLRIRFHNVRGLANDAFRRHFLAQNRKHTDILIVAETNLNVSASSRQQLENWWSCDWKNSHSVIWASGPESNTAGAVCRGMAIFIGNSVPVTEVKEIYKDPGGRSIAIEFKAYNRPVLLMGLHTYNDNDTNQATSINNLLTNVPVPPPDTTTILMTDLNNYFHPALDHMNTDGRPSGPHSFPSGRGAILNLLKQFKIQDVFRTLHPTKQEFTRKHQNISKSRIDYAFTNQHIITRKTAPCLASFRHIFPSDEDLVALRVTECRKTNFGDHAALHLEIDFSDKHKPKPKWSLKRHLLDDEKAVVQMRAIIAKYHAQIAQASSDRTQMMLDMFNEIQEKMTQYEEQRKLTNLKEKSFLHTSLKKCEDVLGIGYNNKCELNEIPAGPHREARRQKVQAQYEHVKQRLLNIYDQQQRRAEGKRQLELDRRGESCFRGFFDNVRLNTRHSSQVIETLCDSSGAPQTEQEELNKIADAFYGGKGGLFNLNTPTDEECSQKLLDALTDDEKGLPEHLRQSVEVSTWLHAENIRLACKSLNKYTASGDHGFPAEFFILFGSYEEKDEEGVAGPPPLTHVLAACYTEMFADCKMTPLMRQGYVAPIFKEGADAEMTNYRPITVLNTLYKILAKTVVHALLPVMPYLVDLSQAAFLTGRHIGDLIQLILSLIEACETTDETLTLLFCDQKKAYDRVNHGFLQKVLAQLGLPPCLRDLVTMLYADNLITIRVNGVDGTPFGPKNGVKQGCPLSTLLYLLAFQPFLSRLNLNQRITKIPIPNSAPYDLASAPCIPPANAFADDLTIALRNNAEIEPAREEITIYEKGSNALLSWPKTYITTVNQPAPDTVNDAFWRSVKENLDPPLIRLLGTFFGRPTHVESKWEELTNKLQSRFDKWTSTKMPASIIGRNIASKSSALAVLWYKTYHHLPTNIEDILTQWKTMTWKFLEFTGDDKRPTSCIRRDVLISDYLEGGARCPDVATFVEALLMDWIKRILQPPFNNFKYFVLNILNETYGHLRQDFRLLTSNCDFLQIPDWTPHFWKTILQLWGQMPGLMPSSTTNLAVIEGLTWIQEAPVRSLNGRKTEVNAMTFAEACMFPLWYNPEIAGSLGAPIGGVEPLSQNQRVELIRPCAQRNQLSWEYYHFSKAASQRGLTHVVDLLHGVNANEHLRLATQPEATARLGSAPLTLQLYNKLINSLPQAVKDAISRAASLRAASPHLTFKELVYQDHIEGTWLRWPDGAVGQVNKPTYLPNPDGLLQPNPDEQPRAFSNNCEQVIVTKRQRVLHNEDEIDPSDRTPAPVSRYMNGPIVDHKLLFGEAKSLPMFPNTDRFAFATASTDRKPRIFPITNLDVNHTYYILLSHKAQTPRTLDRSHIPTTTGSTKWADLFFKNFSKATSDSEARLAIYSSLANPKLNRPIRDSMYRTLHDAFLLGRERCTKKHCCKGFCDAEYLLHGRHVHETLEHILLKCPIYTPVIRAFLFNTVAASRDGADIRRITTGDENSILTTFAREVVTGTVQNSKLACLTKIPNAWTNITGAAISEVLRTRRQNADPSLPNRLDLDKMYKNIRAMIGRIAYALLANAREYARDHAIRYQAPPAPDKCPIKKWEKEWLETGLAKMKGSTVISAFPESIHDTPYLTVPTFSAATLDAAKQRDEARKAPPQNARR